MVKLLAALAALAAVALVVLSFSNKSPDTRPRRGESRTSGDMTAQELPWGKNFTAAPDTPNWFTDESFRALRTPQFASLGTPEASQSMPELPGFQMSRIPRAPVPLEALDAVIKKAWRDFLRRQKSPFSPGHKGSYPLRLLRPGQ